MNSQYAMTVVTERARAHVEEYATREGEQEIELAFAKLEADARALWAVRVLDAWAEHHIRRAPSPVCQVDERWVIAVTAGETVAFYASTPDTARLAAAEAVYPELPVDVRAKLGERP